jgi:hypothetical protein
MIRIPGSYNSKCNKVAKDEKGKVSVIQEWNGIRAEVRPLPFLGHIDKLLMRENRTRGQSMKLDKTVPNQIAYIEKLLKRQVTECRKRIFALVLCPYLVNIKRLSLGESEEIINNYFHGYIPRSLIRYKLKEVLKKGILPYSLKNMKLTDLELYSVVTPSD